MPITVPAFKQYNQSLFPVGGAWNRRPPEGDKAITCELIWGDYGAVGVNTPAGIYPAVQIAIGNSPVKFSQIAAMYVDNSTCGSEITVLFPDTGFSISVPANQQSLFPVISNSLTFFVKGVPATTANDRTVLQILNSIPPPIPLSPLAVPFGIIGGPVAINIPGIPVAPFFIYPTGGGPFPGANGTILGLQITGWVGASAAGQHMDIQITDGNGLAIWSGTIGCTNGSVANIAIDIPLNLRFSNGVEVLTLTNTLASGKLFLSATFVVP